MRSDRNTCVERDSLIFSLVDWDMRSDRNYGAAGATPTVSLVDWDMRSDRNEIMGGVQQLVKSSRLGYAL